MLHMVQSWTGLGVGVEDASQMLDLVWGVGEEAGDFWARSSLAQLIQPMGPEKFDTDND